jgi:peptidoglycan-N-acetylglucosamine deacetylase
MLGAGSLNKIDENSISLRPMRQLASISLDLDNQWSYMRAQGVSGWESYPTYLPVVVPDILRVSDALRMRLTIFVVGRDAEIPANTAPLRQILEAGHDIGNHSYMHEPWMHETPVADITAELTKTQDAIERATGYRTVSFRGPGFAVSKDLLGVLRSMGYVYDASVFPTFLGSMLRKAALKGVNVPAAQKTDVEFGQWTDGFRTLHPHRWQLPQGEMIEIPVTTMPLFRIPIHLTYLHFIAEKSEWLAKFYLGLALTLCQIFRVEPSILLHSLDFIAADRAPELSAFPGMGRSTEAKIARTIGYLQQIQRRFTLVQLTEYAELVSTRKLKTQRL